MARITIVSGIPLNANPRVVKEATTLADHGHDVTVLTAGFGRADDARDRRIVETCKFDAVRCADGGSDRFLDRMDWTFRRLRRRVALELARRCGVQSVLQLGYVAPDLLRHCLRRPTDLYSIHLEQGLWVACELLKRGARISVDIEDWHSEDLRTDERRDLPLDLLRRWERRVLNEAAYSSTTSEALSNALVDRYECPPPLVLYNAFPLRERSHAATPPHERAKNGHRPSVCWVSQTIGPERGLEQLIQATRFLARPIEIHLTGKPSRPFCNSLNEGLDERCKLVFHAPKNHHELLGHMQTCDIGFAGEIAHNRNRDLTVTNKILHYWLAGIPAIASDTAGQLEVCRQAPAACRTYAQQSSQSLGAAIDSLTADAGVLWAAKKAAWDVATTEFCWERNEQKLIAAVDHALMSKQRAPAMCLQ